VPEELQRRSSGWRGRLEIASSVAMLTAALLMIFLSLAGVRKSPKPVSSSQRMSLPNAVIAGAARSGAILVEFSDYECPFCGVFARDIWPRLESRYFSSGRASFAVLHLPSARHRMAGPAALLAICAARQNRFWDFHHALFQNRASLNELTLRRTADDLHLDQRDLTTCLTSIAPTVLRSEVEQARTLSITATPTFLFGIVDANGLMEIRERFSGIRSFETFEAALNTLVSTIDNRK
jgi:protein-disulfide isomerase